MYWFLSILGVLLLIAPFVLGFSANAAALWACVVLGLVVALTAGYKAIAKDNANWELMIAGIAGILAVIAPFAMGFSNHAGALWTSIILGGVVAILADRKSVV